MSFKPQLIADSSGKWSDNGLRFATLAEAEMSARDTFNRWLLATNHRAVESDDPVNYKIDMATGELTEVTP